MTAVMIVVIVICLILSFFFSSADMGVATSDIRTLKKMVKEKKKGSKTALKLAENYEFSMASILFGNNLVNIGASSFVAILTEKMFPGTSLWVGTICLTIFVIVFCEFLPKAFTKRFTYKMFLFEAPLINIFTYIFWPIVFPLSKLFALVKKPLEEKSENEDEVDDEILTEMVDTAEDEGILDEDKADLVRSAIDINDTEVYQIMTPRVDTFFIDIDDDVNEVIKDPRIFDYNRIPVFKDTPDNVIGILPIKSLLTKILNKEKINVSKMMVKPLFIPRNTLVMDLLDDFKKANLHIAIIKDEFGGTDGIITMEDILESIVGEIYDETDEIKEEIIKDKDGSYIIDGNLNIDDMFDLIEYEGDFDTTFTTVSGFAQEFVEGFLKVGDTFKFNNYRFTILETDEFSATKIRVKKIKSKRK